MQKYRIAAMAVGLLVAFTPSLAAAQTVSEFLETANRIPRNPTALVHPGFRRLRTQIGTSIEAIKAEQDARVARSQPKTICLPERVSMDAQALLNRFNAIPEARRNMTVTQAMREWMAERHPC